MDNEFKNEVREQFDEVRERFAEIESILLSLQKSMLIMEDYMKNNIPALFDGYSLNQDQHNEFNQKINNLEKNTDSNSLKISILEDTAKVHSSILESLQS